MIFENMLEEFLRNLRQLTFAEITTVLAKRDDLQSFFSTSGKFVYSGDANSGQEIHAWGNFEELKASAAKPVFSYYCGFTGSIHFCSRAKDNRRIFFLPASRPQKHLPKKGDVIMGQVEDGPVSKRFSWWNNSSVQDRRFKEILCDSLTFSSTAKYEAKLTFDDGGYPNRELFLAVMSLHLQDVDFFVELAKRGKFSQGDKGPPIGVWLEQYIAPLLPSFFADFQKKAGVETAVC